MGEDADVVAPRRREGLTFGAPIKHAHAADRGSEAQLRYIAALALR
jgi:hypothetical protein